MKTIKKQIKLSKEENDLWFKAEMTHRQFAAISQKLKNSEIENEIINLDYFNQRIKKAKNIKLEEVEKWLINCWNTESVLNQNKTIIVDTGESFAMQWAFPQAYYSVYGSLLAHYKALGYTQESHTAVIKHFSLLVEQKKIPECISFYCTGSKRNLTYVNISKPGKINSIEFDPENIDTIENQICQFLKATREINLIDKSKDLKFKNKNGQSRKNLNSEMWQNVSLSIGHTTIIDLLYRKRIKANYQDIDTFSCTHFKGIEVLSNLMTIVGKINLINECFISKAIGIKDFHEILKKHLRNVNNEIIKNRFETIKHILRE